MMPALCAFLSGAKPYLCRVGNTYYVSGEARATRVNDLFSAIAPRYDFLNDVQSFGLHRFWKRRLVVCSGARAGLRALDVCCGTGDLAFALAHAGAAVTGIDFSEPMLAVACRRQQKRDAGPGSRVEFLQGDAMRLPFPDASFDITTVGYGLRNLADWRTGLAEMRRVTCPGGRILVLDFGKPDQPVWRAIYFAYLRRLVPLLGRIFCRDAAAYAYILESLQHYPAQRAVEEEMRGLGCTETRVINFLGGVMSLNMGRVPQRSR